MRPLYRLYRFPHVLGLLALAAFSAGTSAWADGSASLYQKAQPGARASTSRSPGDRSEEKAPRGSAVKILPQVLRRISSRETPSTGVIPSVAASAHSSGGDSSGSAGAAVPRVAVQSASTSARQRVPSSALDLSSVAGGGGAGGFSRSASGARLSGVESIRSIQRISILGDNQEEPMATR